MTLKKNIFFPIPIDFFRVVLEGSDKNLLYKSVLDLGANKTHDLEEVAALNKSSHNHYLSFNVIGYLEALPNKSYYKKSILTFPGSFIELQKYSNIQELKSTKLRSKKKAQLDRQEQKLMTSFNITHQIYFGSIDKVHYDELFTSFKTMLKNRFREKKMKNDDLANWQYYHKLFLPLVLNRKACISVLYHNSTPISFSLNIVYGNSLYGYIKSYNPDFSKYSLGFLELFKLLDWAHKIGLDKFDFLKGEFLYKETLIDSTYFFKKEVLINSESAISIFFGSITWLRISIFYMIFRFLKKLNVHLIYRKLLSLVPSKPIVPSKKGAVEIKILDAESYAIKEMQNIDVYDESYSFLRRHLNNFIYRTLDHIDQVKVFEVKNKLNTYCFAGKKQSQVFQLIHEEKQIG